MLKKCGILDGDIIIKRENLIKDEGCIAWEKRSSSFKEAFIKKFDEAYELIIEDKGDLTSNRMEAGMDILKVLEEIGFLINNNIFLGDFESVFNIIKEKQKDECTGYNEEKLTPEELKDALMEIEHRPVAFMDKLNNIEVIGGNLILKSIKGGNLIFDVIENDRDAKYYIPVRYEIVQEADKLVENSKNVYDYVFDVDDLSVLESDFIEELSVSSF